jgi:hypothetical protein
VKGIVIHGFGLSALSWRTKRVAAGIVSRAKKNALRVEAAITNNPSATQGK